MRGRGHLSAGLPDADPGHRLQGSKAIGPMTPPQSEARARARARDAQAGLPARRAAAELLAAVLQKKQPLDDILRRSLERGAVYNLPARDRALPRAIVAARLRRTA